MSKIALQVMSNFAGTVAPASNVIFDQTVYSSGDIGYDPVSGVVTLNEMGRYVINWWVATQTSMSPDVGFSLVSSTGDHLPGTTPLKTGQVSGCGIVEVTTVPTTLSLVNTAPGSAFLSTVVAGTASLLVVQDEAVEVPSMRCFAVSQLANLISQMIVAYPETTWTVFSQSLASYSGVPLDLYTAPDGTGPAFLRLVDVNGDYETLPLTNLTAIYPGDGTVYDPSFTYLNPPDPLPQNCENDLLAGVRSYLPIGTSVEIRLGPAISASGDVYRNEYGVLILSDSEGNTPVVVATPLILRIFTNGDPLAGFGKSAAGQKKPGITILN